LGRFFKKKSCLTPPTIIWAVGPMNLTINVFRRATALWTSKTSARPICPFDFCNIRHRRTQKRTLQEGFHIFKNRTQGPPGVGANRRPSLLGSFRKGSRYVFFSLDTLRGALRPSPLCLLPFRLRARARRAGTKCNKTPPPTDVQGYRAYPPRTLYIPP